MNVGSDKYHSVGTTCTYKGGKFPLFSDFIMLGVYQGIFSRIYLGTYMLKSTVV